MRSLMAYSSSSARASSLATVITLPDPSFVGTALNTRRVVMVRGNTSSQPRSGTVMRNSVAELAAFVAIGLATVNLVSLYWFQ